MNEHINLIESHLENDFERELFKAVQANLKDTKNALRLNNFAYSARELVRIVLDRLAPTEDVIRCPWYKDETGVKNKPTRAQRILFAIHGGLETDYVEKRFDIPVTHTKACIIQNIDILSKYTHITDEVFNVPDAEDALSLDALSSLSNFFKMLGGCRAHVMEKLSEEVINDEVIDSYLSETDLALDELATHHSIEHVEVYEVVLDSIGYDSYRLKAYGNVYVGLQWGSNSDLRNGDGATMDESFPLEAELRSPFEDVNDVELVWVGANTSEWWDNHYDPE